jgi:hypothetical protein
MMECSYNLVEAFQVYKSDLADIRVFSGMLDGSFRYDFWIQLMDQVDAVHQSLESFESSLSGKKEDGDSLSVGRIPFDDTWTFLSELWRSKPMRQLSELEGVSTCGESLSDTDSYFMFINRPCKWILLTDL